MQYGEALCIGHQLGRVQRRIDVFHHFGLVVHHVRAPAHKMLGGRFPQAFLRRQAAFEYRRGNQSQRHAQLHRVDYRPLAGTFLSGGIQNFIYQIAARLILVPQDVGRNLNEIAAQLALVPSRKDGRHFLVIQLQQVLHHPVGFRDELHVAVFDAVVNHLDKVSRTRRAHPLAARRAVGRFGGDALQNRFHLVPSGHRTARHDGSAVQRALFTAGYACAHKTESFLFGRRHAAVGIFVVGVAAVYQYIARRKQRKQLFHQFVHGTACTNHHHYFTRRGHRLHKTGYIRIAANTLTTCAAVDKTVYHTFFNPRNRTVVNRYLPAFIRHIQRQIFTHYGQPY